MNPLIQRIEHLLLELADSPKQDRSQAIHLWEHFRSESRQSTPAAAEIIEAIDWMVNHREWRFGEPLLLFASRNQDPQVVSKICSLIEMKEPGAPIENAIEILAEVGLHDSVPTLIRAVGFRFDFDSTHQIPIKALHALYDIGSQDALDYLQDIATTEHGLLSKEATRLLEIRGNRGKGQIIDKT